eukprot:433465_1
MIDKVQNELGMETRTCVIDEMYVSVNGTGLRKHVTKNKWDNFRWSENDLFLFSAKVPRRGFGPAVYGGYDINGVSIIKSISRTKSFSILISKSIANEDLNQMAERLLHVYNHVPTMQPKKHVHDMITQQSVSIDWDKHYLHVQLSNCGDDSITDDRYQYNHRLSSTVMGNVDDSRLSKTASSLSSNTSANNYDEQILDKDRDNNTNDVEGHDKPNTSDIIDVHNDEDN